MSGRRAKRLRRVVRAAIGTDPLVAHFPQIWRQAKRLWKLGVSEVEIFNRVLKLGGPR